jgi:hypothetical protein
MFYTDWEEGRSFVRWRGRIADLRARARVCTDREGEIIMSAVKLAITSDLNLAVVRIETLTALAREIAAFNPGAAVLAGDLAESLADLTRVVKLFRQELTCPIWVLPGDHDFWARPPYDSKRLFRELIPQTVANHGCHWLEGQAFTLGDDVAVAGSVAWYDYSAGVLGGMVSAPELAQTKYLYNADALRIDWEWSDAEFAGLVSARLQATLDHLEQDSSVRSILVVTHFPILEQQLVREPGAGLASAYAGNLTLGRKVLAYRKVTHVISGHTHKARQAEVMREDMPSVDVRVVPGEHERPGWLGLTIPETELA